MTITALPTPPSRDDPANFTARADAFLGALPTFATEANALAADVNSDAADAAASAAAAIAASGATKWVSGTTYAEGAVVWSPSTYFIYRRKTAGAGTTDPSSDSTNWALVGGLSFDSPLNVVGNSSGGAEIRLPEDTDNGANYVSVKAPSAITSNRTVTLPDADTTIPIASQQITFSGPTASRTYTLPDASTTLLSTNAAVTVAQGGTGATTLTSNNVILGNGTSAVQFVAPGTNGNVLTSNGTTWTSAAAPASLTGVTDGSSTFNTNLGVGTVNNAGAINNTAVGYQALRQNNLADGNCAFGYQTLQALVGVNSNSNHVAIGYRALYSMATTGSNVAVGDDALFALQNGTWNTAVGSVALQAATSGYSNVGVGRDAGGAITTGFNNTCLGVWAGKSGTNNLTTGSNNTVIGYSAATSSATISDTITLGNSSITTLRCQVTTITSLSDARDKTNIQELDAGLEFVKKLKPVRFTWNMRDGGKIGEADTGFIAQELKAAQEETGKVIPGLVFEDNPEKLEAGYGKLLPVLVKAIQDLSAEIELLKAKLESNNV